MENSGIENLQGFFFNHLVSSNPKAFFFLNEIWRVGEEILVESELHSSRNWGRIFKQRFGWNYGLAKEIW